MNLQTRQSLTYVLDLIDKDRVKEQGRNEQLRDELRESDAKIADLEDRAAAIREDLQR